jgi:hypothetical protein
MKARFTVATLNERINSVPGWNEGIKNEDCH